MQILRDRGQLGLTDRFIDIAREQQMPLASPRKLRHSAHS